MRYLCIVSELYTDRHLLNSVIAVVLAWLNHCNLWDNDLELGISVMQEGWHGGALLNTQSLAGLISRHALITYQSNMRGSGSRILQWGKYERWRHANRDAEGRGWGLIVCPCTLPTEVPLYRKCLIFGTPKAYFDRFWGAQYSFSRSHSFKIISTFMRTQGTRTRSK